MRCIEAGCSGIFRSGSEKGSSKPQAAALIAEYDSAPASFSLGRVLIRTGSLPVAAAMLLLVASNWDAIPRLVRVGLLLALIWRFISVLPSTSRARQACRRGLLCSAT